MTNLTNDLFQLAKLEEGRVLFAEDPINLKRILEEMASSWAEYKTSSGIVVSVSANDDIVIVGDRMRLMEAMQNLVDNAVHHSPINGEVRVDASLCESGATICVIDQGPGLTEAECSKIFEYYYTNSRSGTSGNWHWAADCQGNHRTHGRFNQRKEHAWRGHDVRC